MSVVKDKEMDKKVAEEKALRKADFLRYVKFVNKQKNLNDFYEVKEKDYRGY